MQPVRMSRRAFAAGAATLAVSGRAARAAEDAAYLAFEMKVDWATVIRLQDRVVELFTKGVRDVHLLISSSGGEVSAAVAGYNVLRALPLRLTTYNLGDVDSAASILFMAGRSRACSPSSRLLFHQVRAAIHDADLSRADLKDRLDSVESDTDRIKAIYTEVTGMDAATAESLMARQNWVDPASALKLGVVQRVEPLSVPPSAAFAVVPVPGDD